MSEKDEYRGSTDDRPRLTEMMREIALGGLATYFMTEEAVKGYLKELKLPKELAGLILDSFSKKKDDFYGLLVKEFGKVLSKVDVSKEVSKFLESHRVNVKVSFEPMEPKPSETATATREGIINEPK